VESINLFRKPIFMAKDERMERTESSGSKD
jgi:hypothetical protein